jgi:beta-alanine--pyruvate transaminase
MMGGIDIRTRDKPGKAGFQIYKASYTNGVNFKATADALILAPPYVCEKKHIDEIFEKLRKSITQYMKQ